MEKDYIICNGKNGKNKYYQFNIYYMIIENFNKIHDNKYDYSLVEYINNITKVKIICPIHGIFEQTPKYHKKGGGCTKCSGKYKPTNEEFIEKSKIIHNNKYDYSLVKYVNNTTKVKIICPIHGEFEQIPKSHLDGNNCYKCHFTCTNDFIKKSKEIHNDKYDYSLVEYINNSTKVKIICPEHGIFEQTPNNHMSKKSICPNCNNKNKSLTLDDFIKKSKEIHNDKYDYSLVEYKNNITKVKIICPEHGIFEQTPNSHYVKKNGCPICNESKGEKILMNYFKNNEIYYIRQKKFINCIDINELPFDFYLPYYNVCVEFDGLQHYKSIDYFGGKKTLEYIKKHDEIKNSFCKNNNIKLIRIKYNENIIEKINELF